jgi:WD40 repeat protein
MMDMMTNQEKTLEGMFRAQKSLRKHLQAADPSLDNDSDTASILTSTTNMTILTAFDFDSVIKTTAVYQRCMKRLGDRTSLLSLGLSTLQRTSSSRDDDTTTEEKHNLTSEPPIRTEITKEDVSSPEDPEEESVQDIIEEVLRHVTPGETQPNSSDSDSSLGLTHGTDESGSEYVPPMRLSVRLRDTMVTASSSKINVPREAHWLGSSSQAMEKIRQYNSALPPDLEDGIQMSLKSLYDHGEEITNVAISSQLILATATHKSIRLFHLPTRMGGTEIPCNAYRYTESGLVFSPDQTFLAAAYSITKKATSTVSVWNVNTGADICTLHIHNGSKPWISAIAISADNKLIACSQEDKRHIQSTIVLYDMATGRYVGKSIKLQARTRMLSFVLGDRELLSCSGDRVAMWDVATCSLTRICARLGRAIYHPVLTHDFMLISTNGSDRIYMFDLLKGVRKASVTVPEYIRCLSYSPRTRAIAFAGQNGLVGTWDPRTGIVKRLVQDGTYDGDDNFQAVAISPDGQTVFFAGYTGKLWFWNLQNHEGEYGCIRVSVFYQ